MSVQVGGPNGFTMTRVFDAPREDVWREWTEPEAFADWWGGTQSEVPIDSVAMDVRPGGRWRATMFAGPARHEIPWSGEFVEVDEPERLVFSVTDEDPPVSYDLVIVVLRDLGDGRTEMTLEQQGGMTPEQYERTKQGWGGFMDRLAERVEGR